MELGAEINGYRRKAGSSNVTKPRPNQKGCAYTYKAVGR